MCFGLINPSVLSSYLQIKKQLESSNSKYSNQKNSYKKFLELAYLEKKVINANKNDFKLPLELNNFFNQLSENLAYESKPIEESFTIDINSNTQSRVGSLFIADGDVFIKSSIGIMRASKLIYDEELKKIIIEGDISFKTKTQFLNAKTIKYDFINKRGFILDAYGSIDFTSLKNFFEHYSSENLNDNFEKDFQIKDVILDNSSFINLKNREDINARLNPIKRSRFISDRIEINDDIWSASELKLTNDPYNEPQLIINNEDFKFIYDKNESKIKTKWSSLIFEDKLTIPIGPRNISTNKQSYFKWGVFYDKEKYDGLSLYRSFDPLFFGKKKRIQLNMLSKFNIQRMLNGKTKSFSLHNENILGDKTEQDADLLDYFGIDALINSSIGDWSYFLNAETNSFDLEKLDKALEAKSYINKNIYLKDRKNYFASGELAFFWTFREKTKNGSLGEILVNNSYGVLYDLEILKNKKNINVTRNFSLGYGNFESPSRINSKNLIAKKRANLSLKQKNEYVFWQPKYEKYLTENYKYSPSIIKRGLFWLIEGNADFFRYDDGNKQDIILIKTGPKLVLGGFKNNFFDYTKIELYPRFKFNRGDSPFSFDQVVDSSVIEFNIKQRLYKALAVKFSGEFDLEKNNSTDNLINPNLEISWNRRAYNVGLFYNFDSEAGGINFDIYSFNFNGLGRKFK